MKRREFTPLWAQREGVADCGRGQQPERMRRTGFLSGLAESDPQD
jgi:hypothetical protein